MSIMREIGEIPEWVIPGTPVVVIRGRMTSDPVETTIDRVAKRTFTVAGSTDRFSVDRDQSCLKGSTWGWTERVVPADSLEAQKALRAAWNQKLTYLAVEACDKWIRNKGRANRLAAIAALEAVQDDD